MSSNTRRGRDLLELFTRIGCVRSDENLSGEDLDWIFETSNVSTVEFLDWACRNFQKSNVLSDIEILEWEELKRRSPASILSGPSLQEALQILKSDDDQEQGNVEDEGKLQKQLLQTREELDVTEMALYDLKHINKSVCSTRGKLNAALGKTDFRKEEVSRELTSRQQKLIQVNEDLKSSLEQLTKKIEDIAAMVDNRQKPTNPRFISESDLSPILREDENILSVIKNFIQTRLTTKGNGSGNSWKGGRDQHEFEKLIEEIDRIRFSYADAEKSALYEEAELAGVKAGCHELEKQIQQIKQGKFTQDVNALEASVDRLEKQLLDLHRKITTMYEDYLPPLIDKKVAIFCRDILAADLEDKISRQQKVLSEMNLLVNFLLELLSIQEILGGLFLQEVESLDQLQQQFQSINTTQREIQSNHQECLDNFEVAKENKLRNSRKTLRPNDKVAISISKVARESDVDSCVLTINDVLKSVKHLKEKTDNLEMQLSKKDHLINEEKKKLSTFIQNIQAELLLDSRTGGVLTAPEVSARIQQTLTDVRRFEVSVKDVVEAWDKTKRSFKDNPKMNMEKAIWKDFFNQPEVLERNIQASK